MKWLMAIFWTIWIEAGLILQGWVNYFFESWAGVNPLSMTIPRIPMPFLLCRDDQTHDMEIRAIGEFRNINEEEGIVDAYLTRWDSVDSYNSTFLRGSFRKTFAERAGKIRLLFNHSVLAGKVLEAREDDIGPFVRVKFNLETTGGKDAFAHVRARDVDCFSFGFLPVMDRRNKSTGVREIQEVKCFEVGPVIFEANEMATIEQIRSKFFGGRQDIGQILPFDKTIEERSQDFTQTLKDDELYEKGWRMMMALEDTLWEIWWNNSDASTIIAKMDAAISDFHGTYLAWAQEYMDRFWSDDEERSMNFPFVNDLQRSVMNHIGQSRDKIEDFAKRSSLTLDDLETLMKGKVLPLDRRANLNDLPEPVRLAHHSERRKQVEVLCSEVRAKGYSKAERTRFGALLGLVPMSEEELRASIPPAHQDEAFSNLFAETRSGLTNIFKVEPEHRSTGEEDPPADPAADPDAGSTADPDKGEEEPAE